MICQEYVGGEVKWIAPAAEQDERPVVNYKPCGHAGIEVGYNAWVIPVNHYSATHVTNGNLVRTSTVLAHDKITGAFETKNTRYELDKGYEH